MDQLLRNKIKELEKRRKSNILEINTSQKYDNGDDELQGTAETNNRFLFSDSFNEDTGVEGEELSFSDNEKSKYDSHIYSDESEHDVDLEERDISADFGTLIQPLDEWVLRPINNDDVAVPMFPVNYIQRIKPNIHFPISSKSNQKRLDPEVFFGEDELMLVGSLEVNNFTKIFLELKINCFEWICLFDPALQTGREGSVPSLNFLHQILYNGKLISFLLNQLACDYEESETNNYSCKIIKVDNSEPLKVVYQERRQIYEIIDTLNVGYRLPSVFSFEVNDLYNNENLLRVLISLKAISNFHSLRCNKGMYPWPNKVVYKENTKTLMPNDDLNEYNINCKTEETAHVELLGILKNQQNFKLKQVMKAMVDVVFVSNDLNHNNKPLSTFDDKRTLVRQTLLNNLKRVTKEAIWYDSAKRQQERNNANNSKGELSKRVRIPDLINLSAEQVDAIEVYWWLRRIGMSGYFELFLEDGWDSLSNICLLEKADIHALGIVKQGHIKRLLKSIQQLNNLFGNSIVEANNSDPIVSKQRLDSGWRLLHNLPTNKSDIKVLWSIIKELRLKHRRTQDSLIEKQFHGSEKRLKDWFRALSILTGSLEHQVSKLVPFDAPIIIDIGWFYIKAGFAYQEDPIKIPTICSFKNGRMGFMGMDIPLEEEGLRLRRIMHRGYDSIIEPNLIHLDDFKMLVKYVVRDLLQASKLQNRPIFVVSNSLQSDTDSKEKLLIFLFEKLKARYVYINDQFTLVSNFLGISKGIFIDIGYSRITCAMVHGFKKVSASVVHSKVGFLEIMEELMRLLLRHDEGLNFNSVHKSFNENGFISKEDFLEQYFVCYLLRKHGKIFLNRDERITSEEKLLLKSNLETEPDHIILKECFELVAGKKTIIPIGAMPALACELLFDEKFVKGYETQNIVLPTLIEECVLRARKLKIDSNEIYVFGGGARLEGLKQRLVHELGFLSIFHEDRPAQVIVIDKGDLATWEAAKETVSEQEFHSHWLEKQHFGSQKNEPLKRIDHQKLNMLCPYNGCFPLNNPDTLINESNKSVAALHFLTARFQQEIRTLANEEKKDHNSKHNEYVTTVKEKLKLISDVLKKNFVKKDRILEVQLAISEKYLVNSLDNVESGKLSTLDLLHSLPAELKVKLQKYVDSIVREEKKQLLFNENLGLSTKS